MPSSDHDVSDPILTEGPDEVGPSTIYHFALPKGVSNFTVI
jgi:hypothetical protein